MRRALRNARVLAGGRLVTDHVLLLAGTRIEGLVAPDDARCREAQIEDLGGNLLLPGFIDTQVNGGGGVLFNDKPNVDSIRVIGAAHRRFGTTGFLPTLISDDPDSIYCAIAAVQAAIAAGVPGVLGIHIEGPFINSARKGIHDAAKLRSLDESMLATLCTANEGRTLLTLAPEKTSAMMIRRLATAGVIVAAGHTDATFTEVTAAIAAGMRGFTHLFNAMSPLTARAPGVVGAALYDQSTWCGLIVDGYHVDPITLKLALRCKSRDRFLLVTDAMPPVGTTDRSFVLQGQRIDVIDGVCRDQQGTLAGTVLNMAAAVRNAAAMLDLDLIDAVRMASEYPAHYLGLNAELGSIATGYRANLVEMDNNFTVQRTWIDGIPLRTTIT